MRDESRTVLQYQSEEASLLEDTFGPSKQVGQGLKTKLLLLLPSCLLCAAFFWAAPYFGLIRQQSAAPTSFRTVQLASVSDAAQCIPTCSATLTVTAKPRPLCKDRRLSDPDPALQSLEAFLDGGSNNQKTATAVSTLSPTADVPTATTSTESGTLASVNAEAKKSTDISETDMASKLAAFLSGQAVPQEKTASQISENCLTVKPVLRLSLPVTLLTTKIIVPVELLLPLFVSATDDTVASVLGIPQASIQTRLVASSRRLEVASMDAIKKVGSSFEIETELTDPSPGTIQKVEDAEFLKSFGKQIRDEINRQGASEGTGSISGLAEIGSVTVTDAASDQIDGPFISMGFGTVCRRDKNDTSTDDYGRTQIHTSRSLRDCSKLCLILGEGCFGFEFRLSEQRCELWTEAICESEDPLVQIGTDFECFRRCSLP